MKRILIVANVSSFLYKFERGDVRILQSLGYEVHCAANMHEQHHEGETQVMEQMGVIMHHISVARSPYLYHDNRTALAQLLLLIEKLDIRVLHCHTPVGGVLGTFLGGQLLLVWGVSNMLLTGTLLSALGTVIVFLSAENRQTVKK